MESASNKREGFSSGIAVFFAALSSAIGLGNIWRFPYLTGENGGGAFVFLYLLSVVFIGVPVMVSEFYIGRRAQRNSVGAFKQLQPQSKFWRNIGLIGAVCSLLIMFFYSTICGWVYMYLFKAIKGDFVGITASALDIQFKNAVGGTFYPVLWQFIVMSVVAGILILGVKNGIEKMTKVLMPVLFVLIIICGIKALTLPGAGEGMRFLFAVDFAEITWASVLTALGLALFKLAVGTGAMITYASYFTKDNNMLATSVKVSIADTIVSLLAGIAVFPVVFSYGIEPSGGPGLLFKTIPLVFGQMPMGDILLVAFFLLTAIAGTGASISLTQVSVAYFSEERKMSKVKAVLVSTGIIFVIGILATFSADPSGVLGSFKIFGQTFYGWFDEISSKVLLLLMGILVSIFVGRIVKKDDVENELTNNNTLKIKSAIKGYYFILRYITPVLLIVIFLFNFFKP